MLSFILYYVYKDFVYEDFESDVRESSTVRESSPAIDTCDITNDLLQITVKCTFLKNSMATGLQVIAQQNGSNGIRKLYADYTTDRETPATIVVNEDGYMYLVSVFAIREGRGIVDSSVEYTEQLIIPEIPVTTSTTPANSMWYKLTVVYNT